MSVINSENAADATVVAIPELTIQAIRDALSGLRYGQVTVVVQDGRVMQIDRTERHRLPSERASS
ncbi:YezD family protein [Schlesneria paludicola]|uniref:YezD family protein n=1 Tax=Schlesneria paludicola TaxID=360056 RepID=UPI00029A7D9F|nr:YezD family protein [Schlesneria paludicola]